MRGSLPLALMNWVKLKTTMIYPLDNPVWNALNNGNRSLAQGTDRVKFYPPDVSPFAGMEQNTLENLRGLYDISADHSSFAIVNLEKFDIPQPWTVTYCAPVFQMISENPAQNKSITESIVNLSEEHIPQMLTLTQLTKPGPFLYRTIDFGYYRGIFDGGQLVAMAGQRMHIPPYAEISAVCTHPDYLGRGYAAQLILSQVNRIREAGGIPFLNVATTNERAIKLYKLLGFVIRKEMFIYLIKK